MLDAIQGKTWYLRPTWWPPPLRRKTRWQLSAVRYSIRYQPELPNTGCLPTQTVSTPVWRAAQENKKKAQSKNNFVTGFFIVVILKASDGGRIRTCKCCVRQGSPLPLFQAAPIHPSFDRRSCNSQWLASTIPPLHPVRCMLTFSCLFMQRLVPAVLLRRHGTTSATFYFEKSKSFRNTGCRNTQCQLL